MSISKEIIGQNGRAALREHDLGELPHGHVRVAVTHSGISPGTELLMLDNAFSTKEPFRMGYQATGVVEAVGAGMDEFYKPGDKVACYGGPYVYHASRIDVPRRLVTPLPYGLDSRHAAFCALASIALHGFRHTACAIGETVVVIGLGLLGNLAAQCAQAAGCRVIGSELLPRRMQAADEAGLHVAGSLDELKSRIQTLTDGNGADAVIMAVKNTDDAMLKHAYDIVRRLGRIVILGLSDAQLPREAMFKKEATLVVSRAAGWGRYQPDYELEGRDMPYEHARWTEHRNLEEAIRLMSIGAIKIQPLITDEIPYTECATAYQMLKDAPQDHLAVLFNWAQ